MAWEIIHASVGSAGSAATTSLRNDTSLDCGSEQRAEPGGP